MNHELMLKITNLNKQGILYQIQCALAPGEIMGIIGPSGAGKSTLLRCINRLTSFESGEIIFQGQPVHTLQGQALLDLRQHIGMIFQHFHLIAQKTVFENVALPLLLSNPLPTAALQTKVMQLLDLCQIADKKDAYPSTLSGGQKQRVAIARALARDPKLLLCDEATSALDPQSTQNILQLLKEIAARLKVGILLVTHEMDVIKQLCDKAIVLDKGHVIEQGPVLDLFVKPQQTVTKELVQKTIHLSLPSGLAEHLKEAARTSAIGLYRIAFVGEATTQPLLSHVIARLGVTVNILQAHIEQLQEKTLGFMLSTLSGSPSAIEQALLFLTEHHCVIEQIDYVD